MLKVIILGTSYAIPTNDHENTHMVVVGEQQTVLIDCVNHPILRLQEAGVDHNQVSDLIITHFHPDHVSGLPSLLMNTWLLGRNRPLEIYGLSYTLDRAEQMMSHFNWNTWPGLYAVNFHQIASEPMVPVLQGPEFRILASPVKHIIPTVGLRIEAVRSGKVLAYSCDTEPTPAVVELALGADVLIHEASGNSFGHSSALQAGTIAQQAGAGSLYLIHYPTGQYAQDGLVEQAQNGFDGPVSLAEDFLTIEL